MRSGTNTGQPPGISPVHALRFLYILRARIHMASKSARLSLGKSSKKPRLDEIDKQYIINQSTFESIEQHELEGKWSREMGPLCIRLGIVPERVAERQVEWFYVTLVDRDTALWSLGFQTLGSPPGPLPVVYKMTYLSKMGGDWVPIAKEPYKLFSCVASDWTDDQNE